MKQHIETKWLSHGELPMVYTEEKKWWKLGYDLVPVEVSPEHKRIKGDFLYARSVSMRYSDAVVLQKDKLEYTLLSSILSEVERIAEALPCPNIICFFTGQKIVYDDAGSEVVMETYCSLLGHE